MNDLERRLSDLLQTGAPEPERVITASEIAALAQDAPPLRGRVAQRWGMPALAAAGVLLAVAVPTFVFGHVIGSATPTSPTSRVPAAGPTAGPTAAPTRSSSPTTGITAGSVSTCRTSQLSLTPGLTSGTAGSLYTSFFLTNTSGTSCSMRGFPGVSLLNNTGSVVGQPATRDGSEGPSVRLGPGQRAQFTLRVGTATRTGCSSPRPSRQVEVYPPDQTAPLRIPFTTGSCDLSVRSVAAGP